MYNRKNGWIGVKFMDKEAFDGIIRYLDHTIEDDKKIYKQVMQGRDYEAEMFGKAITITASFINPDMQFTGQQVKDLLKYIYEVPFQ